MIIFDQAIEETMQIMQGTVFSKDSNPITTGYWEVDKITRGMQHGSLTVVASLPSIGKTAFALNIVRNLMKKDSETPILYCSNLSHTELTLKLLTIISGVEFSYDCENSVDRILQWKKYALKKKSYPLIFEENRSTDNIFFKNLCKLCLKNGIKLLIFDPVEQKNLQFIKQFARKLDIPVLALISITSDKTQINMMESADTVIHLVRKQDKNDPDLGARFNLIVVRNRFGRCGMCTMFFLPQIMRFMESRTHKKFVVIPEKYKPVTPLEELKKYISPNKLPLLEHLQKDIPQDEEKLNSFELLKVSACLEAVGDHKSSIKYFMIGRNLCYHCEKKAEVIYDWLFAAMNYWFFRDIPNATRCMTQAKKLLDYQTEREFQELERRIKTYTSAEWIKDYEIRSYQ